MLVIDLDAQANLTMATGFQSPDEMKFTILQGFFYDMILSVLGKVYRHNLQRIVSIL
ncbi:MAG: hypothetical protein SOZ82_06420 [Eubacteriales bacterium]|nr:hypothetical protein [Eubacteriales bacterium]